MITKISSNLSKALISHLTKAEELWVAVGLMNLKGLDQIMNAVPLRCKLNFVVGIDLPTDPKALTKLLYMKRQAATNLLIEQFFHPKVYIIKSKGYFIAFVGSANCTLGGLEENIEMTLITEDQTVCRNLLEWFQKSILPASQPLTAEFIKDYEPKYANRIKRRKKEKEEVKKIKQKEQQKIQANIKYRRKFISALTKIRNSTNYQQYVLDRDSVLKDLRKSLDYPNFLNIDLKTFFSIKQLGTIVPIQVKGEILRNKKKFSKLMKLLCNENISITERVDQALDGKLSIRNVGEGFITKVLVIHQPKKYYLHNKAFTERLKPFGLELSRGVSFGVKYEKTRDILNQILRETKIKDFAVLDYCIWML
jgi:HKD family nuclease